MGPVNPRDQSYIRSLMENLQEADARLLSAFGPRQGLISGAAVRLPLLVKMAYDKELENKAAADEKFLSQAAKWKAEV